MQAENKLLVKLYVFMFKFFISFTFDMIKIFIVVQLHITCDIRHVVNYNLFKYVHNVFTAQFADQSSCRPFPHFVSCIPTVEKLLDFSLEKFNDELGKRAPFTHVILETACVENIHPILYFISICFILAISIDS